MGRVYQPNYHAARRTIATPQIYQKATIVYQKATPVELKALSGERTFEVQSQEPFEIEAKV